MEEAMVSIPEHEYKQLLLFKQIVDLSHAEFHANALSGLIEVEDVKQRIKDKVEETYRQINELNRK